MMAKDVIRESTADRESVRPLDLGLSEGKSMAFAPTQVLQPEGPVIGGLAPASPNGAGADRDPAPAASPNPPSERPASSDSDD
jgi:hypothetical protein